MRVLYLVAGMAVTAGLAARAQGPKAAALPADVVPATFRALLVTDDRFPPIKEGEGKNAKEMPNPLNRAGKIHCLVCENGLAPVVAIFVRAEAKAIGPDKGVAKLVKDLNALIPKYKSDKLAGFVMFLNLDGGKKSIKIPGAEGGTDTTLTVDQEFPDTELDKREGFVKDIRSLANAVKAAYIPFGLAPASSDAVKAWRIGEKDDVTVVVYDRMRVAGKPWVFPKLSDLTDEKIAEILKSVEKTITAER